MVYTTYFQWFGAWFIIVLPTLLGLVHELSHPTTGQRKKFCATFWDIHEGKKQRNKTLEAN